MKIKIQIVLFIFLLFLGLKINAQKADSLKQALKKAVHDTTKVKLLVMLSDACEINEIENFANSAINLCEQQLKKEVNTKTTRQFYLKYLGASYNNLGFLADEYGDIVKAIAYYNKSLKIQEEINDQLGISYSLNNIGYVYSNIGDVPKALDYFHQSLKIQEDNHDKSGIAYSLINIGNILKNNGNIPKAMEYFQKSLKLKEELNDPEGIAISLLNIGSIYDQQGDQTKALTYYEKALMNYKSAENKYGIAYAQINIGNISKDRGDLDKALSYFERSLELQEEIQDKAGISKTLGILANVYFKQKKVNLALNYAEKSLKIGQELGYIDHIQNSSSLLSRIYSDNKNYKQAYQMQVLFKQMSDSNNNQTNRKASLQKGFQYEYDKKAAADSVKTIEERLVFDVQLKQEKTQRTALYIGIGLIALFSAFMYNRFRITNKQKEIIELQKIEVENQRSLADSRRIIAEEQKEIIEEKQKEIIDSIHYAKRIQQAMLTSENYFDEHLKAEYFIYYQPKDIVSGDFYWATYQHNQFYIATADCTGHGVPGAFMSLLNINFLNENVIERGIKNPAQVLNEQRKEIIKALNPKGNENSKDGMDCVLCAFDLINHKLSFAAANNPVWLIRNHELTEYKGDKMPVGKYEDNAKDFTSQSIDIQKGDMIYTFTDGYADQFGGEKGKKFKYKQLQSILLNNHQLPMNEQRVLLSETINNWKGNQEQLDDILVIGVRV